MAPGLSVRAILFDIGGVLIALDGVPTMARLLGVEPAHETIHEMWMASASVLAYESGKIGAEEFAAGVVADLGLSISPAAFLADFCRWPGALQPGALDLLDAIPRRYRVAALSNTSAMHWQRIAATGLPSRFERTFLSHEIGHLKPSPDAFHCALRGLELPASDVLFLDDGVRNVTAAAALGMPAHVARNPAEARSVLVEYGVVL
jgi:putative hydrolase of the HAD superfamily